jgi:hypothetical protein
MDVQLNYKAAIIAADSTAIITKKNGAVDLLFLQFTNEGPQPAADVVAGARLSSIAELEDLQKTIAEALQKHKTAER